MRVMTAFGFIFNMRRRNRDPAGFLFRRSVNLIIILKFAKLLRNRSRQCRLTMVNVTNRANVAMRLTTPQTFPLPWWPPFSLVYKTALGPKVLLWHGPQAHALF